MRLRLGLAFASCCVFALQSVGAFAQSTSVDKAIATQLFDDAETLISAGDTAAACPKFAESQRRDPQLGTLLHLADCNERLGKIASAWAEFKEAFEIAARRNASGAKEPREQIARGRAAALEPKVSRLTLNVGQTARGIEVRQNGEPIVRAVWGSAVPIDPGVYAITAYAPNKRAWTKMIEVPAEGAQIEVRVPFLEDEGGGEPAARSGADAPTTDALRASTAPTAGRGGTQRTMGYVVAGLGVVGIGVGAAFAIRRNSQLSDRDAICPSSEHCTAEQGDQIDTLTQDARKSTTGFAVATSLGAAAVIGGVVLVLTSPRSPSGGATAVHVEPWAAPSSIGLRLGKTW